MIKIFLTVRNRLGITIKCLEAIKRHTTIPHQIYVYNNQSNYLVEDHFKYFCKLYMKGLITQVTFNTDASTFNAFSKASACNMFGLQHEQDPKKSETDFILMLDNDIILTPDWDQLLLRAWKYVKKNKLNHIKVIGQLPGGIKHKNEEHRITEDLIGHAGMLGGSGLWSVRSNFFTDVGLLPLNQLVGQNKRHDQLYWQLLQKASGSRHYIMGLDKKLGIHCGSMAGSVCNVLTRNRTTKGNKKLNLICFEEADNAIKRMDFDTFFEKIYNNKQLIADW
jgi:hypothetical protein